MLFTQIPGEHVLTWTGSSSLKTLRSIQAVPVTPPNCYRQRHKAKGFWTVPCTSSHHLMPSAAMAAPSSALHSYCGARAIMCATAINVLLWEMANSLFSGCCSPAVCKPVLPSQGFRSWCEGTGKVCCGWWEGAGPWERNMWARVDVLAGSVVWRWESWNTGWHPGLGRRRMNMSSPRQPETAAAHGGNGAN